MSHGSKPKPIASLDAETGRWVDSNANADLFSEQLPSYSGTWPTSGMTRNGSAYALPTWVHPMDDSASSSLLPTPNAADGNGAGRMNSPGHQSALPGTVREELTLLGTPRCAEGMQSDLRTAVDHPHGRLEDQISLLPTPDAYEASRGGSQHPDKRKAGGHSISLQDVTEHALLLPTPTVQDAANTAGPSQRDRNSVPLNTVVTLLPTPRATDGTKGGPNQHGSSGDLMLPSAVQQFMQEEPPLLPTPRAQHGEGRNQNIWERPLDQPQNLENTLARIGDTLDLLLSAGGHTDPPSTDGKLC
jgi:hypothetical protein